MLGRFLFKFSEPYNIKSDLWSIGIMMYQFLTGKFPFEGVSPFQMCIALDHAVLTFPEDLIVSKQCLTLIRGLLQSDPAKRIGWDTFFSSPFLSLGTSTEINSEMLDSSLAGITIMDSQMELDQEQVIVKEIDRIRLKITAILKTFNDNNRVLVIDTCTKEIFDILWKLSKRLKPIIGFFAPKSKALVFQSDTDYVKNKHFMKVITSEGKEISIQLSKSLIHRVQRNEMFEAYVDKLIREYETIVSNLVGYAEVVTLMSNYNSLYNLFKYSIALGHEGDLSQHNQKDINTASMKYFQALLILELILSEIYVADKMYKVDNDCLIVNEEGKLAGQQYRGKNIKVEELLSIKGVEGSKVEYLRKLRNELKARCLKLKKDDPLYTSVLF